MTKAKNDTSKLRRLSDEELAQVTGGSASYCTNGYSTDDGKCVESITKEEPKEKYEKGEQQL